MSLHRRTLLHSGGAAAAISALGAPAIAQAKTKIRIGYLHTLAVDGQMWLADHLGAGPHVALQVGGTAPESDAERGNQQDDQYTALGSWQERARQHQQRRADHDDNDQFQRHHEQPARGGGEIG